MLCLVVVEVAAVVEMLCLVVVEVAAVGLVVQHLRVFLVSSGIPTLYTLFRGVPIQKIAFPSFLDALRQ